MYDTYLDPPNTSNWPETVAPDIAQLRKRPNTANCSWIQFILIWGGWRRESAAGVTTDITSTTGIDIIGPAPSFSGFVRYRWGRRPAKIRAGTTGIAQNPKTRCGTN